MVIYWRPLAQIGPARPADALPLAGGPGWFTHVPKMTRDAAPEIVPARDLPADWRRRLTAPRRRSLGLTLDRPRLMGILNVTPDSFSDGGQFTTRDAAVAQAEALCDGRRRHSRCRRRIHPSRRRNRAGRGRAGSGDPGARSRGGAWRAPSRSTRARRSSPRPRWLLARVWSTMSRGSPSIRRWRRWWRRRASPSA